MKLRRTIVVVVLLLLIGLLAILIRSRHQPTVSTLSLIKKDTASLQSPPSMGGNQVKTNSTYVSGSETTPELSSLSGGGIATAELDSQLNSARSNQVPRDWRVISNGPISNRQLYRFASDFQYVWNGSASVSLSSMVTNIQQPSPAIVQMVLADPFLSKRVRFSAMVRTQKSVPEFNASLWVRVQDTNGLVLSGQNMHDHMIPGNSDWTEYSIVFDVPVSSSVLFYGAFVQNAGTLWMDDVHLSIVDASTRLTGVPVTAGQGKITLAIDRAHVLSMPENLDFEETVTSDDRIWWQEVIQPNFR